MIEKPKTIVDAIRLAVGDMRIYSKLCKVDDINYDERTINCTPVDGDAGFIDAKLQADYNGESGIVAFPKKDSLVMVAQVSNNLGYVTAMQEITEAEVKIGDAKVSIVTDIDNEARLNVAVGKTKMDITDNGVVFNDGGNGGLTNTGVLKAQLDKLSARVDTIIDAITNAKSSTEAPDGGALYKTNMITILKTNKEKENFSTIEDINVKH